MAYTWPLCAPLYAGPATVGAQLSKISTVSLSESRVDVLLHLDGRPEFSAFRLHDPERVVIDLSGVGGGNPISKW